MELLTKELKEKLPVLYSQDGKNPEEVQVVAKFFHPFSNWTWYATEFDGEDTFFGLVRGDVKELGYFSLAELEGVRVMGLGIERDMYFGPHTLKEVMDENL